MTEKKNIPKHWQVIKLGEYVISVKGKKPKRVSPVRTAECSIPYVNIKAFETGIIDEFTDGTGCVFCEENDFLMVWDGSRSGYVGKAIKGALGSTLVKLKFPDIDINYAYFYLQSKFLEINTRAKGVGIPHVDPSLLWNYRLPIPPLPEQRTIVSKIEELLSGLDNGKQQLLTAQQQLKVYRQSLLKAAFEGKLTVAWRKAQKLKREENLAMAAEPEVTYLNNGELPEGWEWAILGEVLKKIEAGKSFKCDERPPKSGETGVLKVSAVTWQVFDENESKTVLEKERINNSYFVKENDFLFSRANTLDLIGAVVLVKSINKKLMLSDKTLRFVFKSGISKKYILYYLRSRKGRKEIQRLSTGNQESMRNIGQERIKQIEFPNCSIEEQLLIVDVLESKLTVCNKMEETITQSLKRAEMLRQSILKRAFEGKLV